MEAFAAVSLASSVVQFVDFALNVVSKGRHIYHAGDGTISDNHDLEIVANDLLLLQTRLDEATSSSGSAASNKAEDHGMKDLLAVAQNSAKDLLLRLNMAKVQGRFRRWKSLRQALKSVWSKKEVDSMFQRLELLKQQLQLRIIVTLR
jgi:hypothetical protein